MLRPEHPVVQPVELRCSHRGHTGHHPVAPSAALSSRSEQNPRLTLVHSGGHRRCPSAETIRYHWHRHHWRPLPHPVAVAPHAGAQHHVRDDSDPDASGLHHRHSGCYRELAVSHCGRWCHIGPSRLEHGTCGTGCSEPRYSHLRRYSRYRCHCPNDDEHQQRRTHSCGRPHPRCCVVAHPLTADAICRIHPHGLVGCRTGYRQL